MRLNSSQADSAGSIPVTRSTREKRCKPRESDHISQAGQPSFVGCNGTVPLRVPLDILASALADCQYPGWQCRLSRRSPNRRRTGATGGFANEGAVPPRRRDASNACQPGLVLLDTANGDRPLADSAGDALHGSVPHVADREHARQARLERQGCAEQWPCALGKVAAGQD
jgi:hypothetical protein